MSVWPAGVRQRHKHHRGIEVPREKDRDRVVQFKADTPPQKIRTTDNVLNPNHVRRRERPKPENAPA